jgi:hypothetical protein
MEHLFFCFCGGTLAGSDLKVPNENAAFFVVPFRDAFAFVCESGTLQPNTCHWGCKPLLYTPPQTMCDCLSVRSQVGVAEIWRELMRWRFVSCFGVRRSLQHGHF